MALNKNYKTSHPLLDFLLNDYISCSCTPIPQEILDASVYVAVLANPQFENHPFKTKISDVGNGKENVVIKIYFEKGLHDFDTKTGPKVSEPLVIRFGDLIDYAREQVYGIEFGYLRDGKTFYIPLAFMDVERYFDFKAQGAKPAKSDTVWYRRNKLTREELTSEQKTSTKILSDDDFEYIRKVIRDLELDAKVDIYFVQRNGPIEFAVSTLIDITFKRKMPQSDYDRVKDALDGVKEKFEGSNILGIADVEFNLFDLQQKPTATPDIDLAQIHGALASPLPSLGALFKPAT